MLKGQQVLWSRRQSIVTMWVHEWIYSCRVIEMHKLFLFEKPPPSKSREKREGRGPCPAEIINLQVEGLCKMVVSQGQSRSLKDNLHLPVFYSLPRLIGPRRSHSLLLSHHTLSYATHCWQNLFFTLLLTCTKLTTVLQSKNSQFVILSGNSSIFKWRNMRDKLLRKVSNCPNNSLSVWIPKYTSS